jgi:hypothetical protein
MSLRSAVLGGIVEPVAGPDHPPRAETKSAVFGDGLDTFETPVDIMILRRLAGIQHTEIHEIVKVMPEVGVVSALPIKISRAGVQRS